MTGKKAYLIVQTVLCCLLVFLLSQGVVRLYLEGTARKAEQPLEAVFTPQAVTGLLLRLSPLFIAAAVLTAIGLALGIRDERTKYAKAQLKPEKSGRKPRVQIQQPYAKANVLRAALLLAAGIFIVLGALNGSLRDVLLKAINLCTECVGLG